jgi:flagellar hook assembly protein FlgD
LQPTEIADAEKLLRVWHSQITPLRGEQARIRWYQFKDNPVKLTIYNQLGDKVAGLPVADTYQAGRLYEVTWSGKTDRGATAGSGIYIVYLESGDYKAWTKIAVVK